ncbi:MAG: glycerol kinase GlpK [Bacteroidota bacterium]|nr:glycerol kinase GlpK [Bacteroidota bacterium]
MNEQTYVLAFDQGTTSCRSILFDDKFSIVGISQMEIEQYYPHDAWVEQDAEEIYQTQVKTAQDVLQKTDVKPSEVAGIGITNQRESFVVWNKHTGKPVHPCIVWQDRRTAAKCDAMAKQEISHIIRRKTGLLSDPYFSGTKLQWLLEHVPGAKAKAKNGEYLFGTIDTWLIWKLSGGNHHITDVSNASRTLLFNIHNLDWDDELLEYFDVPRAMLPRVVDSSGQLAKTHSSIFGGAPIQITGIAGDQQAALYGQICHQPGMVKNTCGTGAFVLMNVGNRCPVTQDDGLLRTVAWRINGKPTYALEGSVFFAGATIKWMQKNLQLFNSPRESEEIAASVPDTAGVYFVPAFAGLGTPYWDPGARGTIIGLTQAAGKAHVVRAGLESLAYQTQDVIQIMQKTADLKVKDLRVDGGVSGNNFFLQFLSDIAGVKVIKPEITETTALGAAFLAAQGSGICNENDIKRYWSSSLSYMPHMSESKRKFLHNQWKRAVERSRRWYVE